MVTEGPHNPSFGKIYLVRKTPGLPSKDDVDFVPQKDQNSVARELSTALDKYKDVSSARFSIQENDPRGSKNFKK